MRYKILTLIMFFVTINLLGQESSTQTNTSLSSDETISTTNNVTVINLFNIDYNGGKIPINIIYNHSGHKVDETPSSLGIGWEIQNMGIIQSIVNYRKDSYSNGWFNTSNPNFDNDFYYNACGAACGGGSGILTEDDLSPDFFLLNTANGHNFDFIFKKSAQIGVPTPILLSNDDGYKINTNFNNFIDHHCVPNNEIVFNVVDKTGNNYNFINGPLQNDIHRNYEQNCRNNYYLKSMSNAANIDFISIDYYEKNVIKKKEYKVGVNHYSNNFPPTNEYNFDYNNNIIREVKGDYFFVDESRFDLKTITSNSSVVEFKYNATTDKLDEILISDTNGNFITGYKFEYNLALQERELLWKVLKYNNNKTQTQLFYEFEYFDGIDFFNNEGQYGDFFGFSNNQYKSNLMPFQVRRDDGALLPQGDFYPDLNAAKQHVISKIKSRYGGITEFDYQLKKENHQYWGNIYGGGLVISSKKNIPIIGETKLTTYQYQNLIGFILMTDIPEHHYITNVNSTKFTSQQFALDETYESLEDENWIGNMQSNGSFFKKITEEIFDFQTMQKESTTIRNYVPNFEGVFRKPILKKESINDSNNHLIKEVEYFYDYKNIETINRATFGSELRSAGQFNYVLRSKKNNPININRIKLKRKTEKLYNTGEIMTSTDYEFVSQISKRLRSTSATNSIGENLKTILYYSDDSQMSLEPFINDLNNKNIIGEPLLIESFRNSEKTFSEKRIFKNWTNNFVSPELSKKAKGQNVFEYTTKVNLIDNLSGNTLEVQQENGIIVSYLWGYNNKNLIARIENLNYSSIPGNLIVNAQQASDSGNELSLLNALNALRNHSSLTNAFVTTYTYKPLIGLSSQTTPNGDKTTYEYDDFNNLKLVRDTQGNILTEKEYHFKN